MPREPTQQEKLAKQRIQQLIEQQELRAQQLIEQQKLRAQQLKEQQEQQKLRAQQLKDEMEQSKLEREAESKKISDAFDNLRTKMHEILTRREKEVNAFYDQLDKWENEVALTKRDRCKILCEKLEHLPEEYDEHFFTLQYFIQGDSSWKLDRTTAEYLSFMSFDEDKETNLNEMKKAALLVLQKQINYEGIRRFIDEIIGDGVPETHFVFC